MKLNWWKLRRSRGEEMVFLTVSILEYIYGNKILLKK